MSEEKKNTPLDGGFRPGRGHGPGTMMNIEKPKATKETLKRLMKYLGAAKTVFVLLVVFAVIVSLTNVLGPVLQGDAIDAITVTADHVAVDLPLMMRYLIMMLILYAGQGIFQYFQGFFAARLAYKTILVMRNDLFNHLVRLPVSYTDTHPHGDIMSRMTNDVENISNTVSQAVGSLFSGVIQVIGSLVVMFILSWFLTLVSLLTVFLTILVTKWLSRPMRKLFKEQQALLGTVNARVEESVHGFRTVAAYNQENAQIASFNVTSHSLRKASIKASIISSIMGPLMNVIHNISFLIVAILGGLLAVQPLHLGLVTVASISVGTIAMFITLTRNFSRPISEIANLWSQIQTALAGAERVFTVLDSPVEIDQGCDHLDLSHFQGDVVFDHVTFAYVPDHPVLHDFSLEVKPGMEVALVGATGSGKTTIVNLLMRFYDPQEGRILIDGIDITTVPKEELRRAIAIVLQDTVLFTTTIKENICYGKTDATEDEMEQAAHFANVSEFVTKLPQKYETVLASGGGNLSQGQRQLITIARAVLADPKILILDEATSSVDTRTELAIQSAMAHLMKDRTSLLIAHRLSTIQDADLIVVIDAGRLVERGTHAELLALRGTYYRLYSSQFAGNAI